jgi:hypothetical protein
MASEPDELAANVRGATAALADMEKQLRTIQTKVSGLGFFARGFVEKDIKSATGRSFAEWIKAAERVRLSLENALGGNRTDAVRAIADELPRVTVLRNYLRNAPKKINMVPAAVLKPQQRVDILHQVDLQDASLVALESKMQEISLALTRAE